MSKERMVNSENVEGWLYQHKLEKRMTGENSKNPGTEYIRGTVDIATDDDMMNIISVNYTYVTDAENAFRHDTFVNLSNIVNGVFKTVVDVGVENRDKATKLRLSPSLSVNDFISNRETGEMAAPKRNEGGGIRVITSLNADEAQRSTFRCDMIITNVVHREADEERGYAARADVSGYVFDFRKDIIPVTFEASNPSAMRYFENLDATEENPVFTMVSGLQKSNVTTRKLTVESAFGDPVVREVTNSRKSYEITWAQPEEYAWDDASTYTVKEFNEAKQRREVHLADVKSRDEEWRNRSTGNAFTSTTSTAVAPSAGTSSSKKMEFDF